ncbi:MAG: hypothetical protein KJN78_04535 [Gammaproteobacteria bacterium]|nr:hypothetical protein [Gammaproteobacteria bacterium]
MKPGIDGQTGALAARMQRIAARLERKRFAQEQALVQEGFSEQCIEQIVAENEAPRVADTADRQPYRGRDSKTIIEQAQLELIQGEQAGRYIKAPVDVSSEFPTTLTRLPIFVPGRRSNQRGLIDDDNAMALETAWGKIRKHGPPLTVGDEDTLMALGRLRQDELRGRAGRMPISVQDPLGKGRDLNVHVLYTTLAEIEAVFGTAKSGQAYKARLESIRRLAATRLDVERLSGAKLEKGTVFSLFDIAWNRWEKESLLFIQFSPIMTHWFENAFTYIDWNVRMAIPSDAGKAAHRFLSGQPKRYEIGAEKLRKNLLYQRAPKYFIRELRQSFGVMKDVGWLKRWHIEGNGRRVPQKIVIER